MNVCPSTEMKGVDGSNAGGGDLGEDNVYIFGHLSAKHQWNYIESHKLCS